MIKLPYDDPGVPDRRSPLRFLLWVGRKQKATLAGGIFFGIFWMLAQALMPFAIGAAIQRGIAEHDNQALAKWTLVLLGLGLVQAIAGVMRHRFAVTDVELWEIGREPFLEAVGPSAAAQLEAQALASERLPRLDL